MGHGSRRRRKLRRPRQTHLAFRTWGGRRKGAGRKPKGEKPGGKHARRSSLPRGSCVHVTLRAAPGISKLRGRKPWAAVRDAARTVLDRKAFRICELSLM